jgi:acetyltransferase-like isoleucine patch superfamily enzyme
MGPVEVLLRDGASWRNISIGDNVTFGGKVYIRLRKNGRLIIEDNVKTGTEVWLVGANDNTLKVGKGSNLGSYSILNGGHGLSIGEKAIFAGFVYVNTSDHGFEPGKPIIDQPFVGAPVNIGSDVWLGGHCFVGKGVTIGDGAVVGASSMVTKDLPGNSINYGNPCRFIKERQ